MRKTFKHMVCLAIAITAFTATAVFASPNFKNTGAKKQPLSFIENKGQVKDQDNKPRTDIDFRLPGTGGLNIFIGSGAIHYQFSKVGSPGTELEFAL